MVEEKNIQETEKITEVKEKVVEQKPKQEINQLSHKEATMQEQNQSIKKSSPLQDDSSKNIGKKEESIKTITPVKSESPKSETSKVTNKLSKNDKKEAPKIVLDRTYTIPLKKAFLKAPKHERARIAIREIKRFLVRNMKIRDHDLDKIKVETYFNNYVWSRGKTNPPIKVNVRAYKIDGIVRVDFLDVPESVKFTKAKNDRRHVKSDQKPVIKSADSSQEEDKKTPEEKKDEKEKEQSVAELNEKQQEQKAKAEKHTGKVSKDKSAMSKRQVLSRH